MNPVNLTSLRSGSKFSPRERLHIGLFMLFGQPDDVTDLYGCSRSYAYECRTLADQVLECLTDDYLTNEFFVLDKKMTEAMVISLSCACKSSLEGIQYFFQMLFNRHISIGSISQILTDAGKRAAEINRNFILDSVRKIGADEIYMGQDMPVMTVVDLESTFLCAMNPVESLSAERWKELVSELHDNNGLMPDICVMDGGSALNKGIPEGLEGIIVQPDIFHMFKDAGAEIAKFKRYAESLIMEEEKLMVSVNGQRIHKKSVKKLEEVREELEEVLPIYDKVERYYALIRACFGFCGYSHNLIIDFVREMISEMLLFIPSLNDIVKEECAGTTKDLETVKRSYMTRKWKRYNSLRKALHRLRDRIDKDAALGFLKRLEADLSKLAKEFDVPEELICDIYRLYGYQRNSDAYDRLDETIFSVLYTMEKEDLYELLRHNVRLLTERTVRASSLVENTNQKIRPFINSKRALSEPFCALIQLYINTRKYRRSIKGRKGKSPAELMTGKCHPPFLELLGFV